jgi:CBS domain containing-hemolysin-like protein
VRQAAARGALEPVEERLIQRIFAYTDRHVRDVMQPRGNVVALDVNTPPSELMKLAREVGFSRFPVVEGELDRPVGYVHIKDIMWAQDEASLRPFLRPLVYIPETAALPAAFSRLTRARRHIALVLDEYGGTEGLVTLEDLLEVIVGEIEDEHSPAYEAPRQVSEGVWLYEGTMALPEVEDLLDIEFEDSGYFSTLAGFILHEIGALPQVDTMVEKYGYRFTVVALEERRVSLVRVARPPAAHDPGEAPGL